MLNLRAFNSNIVTTTTTRDLSVSFEKNGQKHELSLILEVFYDETTGTKNIDHVYFSNPLPIERDIVESLTEDEQKAILAFAEKTMLEEMENEILVNVGEIARTMQSDFGFEVKGDEEEWDNYTNAAMDSLEQVYGFETKLTAALKQ